MNKQQKKKKKSWLWYSLASWGAAFIWTTWILQMWHGRAHIQGQRMWQEDGAAHSQGSSSGEEAEAGAGNPSSMSCAAEALLNSNERRRRGAGLLIIRDHPGNAICCSVNTSTKGCWQLGGDEPCEVCAAAEGKGQLSNISQGNKKKYSIWSIKCFCLSNDLKFQRYRIPVAAVSINQICRCSMPLGAFLLRSLDRKPRTWILLTGSEILVRKKGISTARWFCHTPWSHLKRISLFFS